MLDRINGAVMPLWQFFWWNGNLYHFPTSSSRQHFSKFLPTGFNSQRHKFQPLPTALTLRHSFLGSFNSASSATAEHERYQLPHFTTTGSCFWPRLTAVHKNASICWQLDISRTNQLAGSQLVEKLWKSYTLQITQVYHDYCRPTVRLCNVQTVLRSV